MTSSTDKPDQPDIGSSKKKPVSTPKDKQTKEKKPKSSHKRGKGLRHEEIYRLLDLIITHLPLGAVGWEAVADKSKKSLLRLYSKRSAEALKCKIGALKNAPKPTGNPDCPPDVPRAKRIQHEIECHSVTIDLDDDDDHHDLGDITTHEDEDEEDDEEDTDDQGQESLLSKTRTLGVGMNSMKL
ncbi:hypothetical protein BDK51DRAFT_48576 [Blyttiomyces helicus]|uniref:DUF6818 domain-containing protein n=1 Tax=Blyttiomyces helicus TaxID=388810 RepID=A0A4P9WKI5_9FUNG|nr:hypothetical protein BDK51DRAFT_48576 [Blyttiomyces helicus]|eukprot:RKO92523.1 hypothetical protein BDK51DRAFT_48576 [Blyttiomyces helicus]